MIAAAARPRILVAYYSRSGNTERVARALAAELGADLERIVDRTDRRGFLGYLRAGRDAIRRRGTEIAPPATDPPRYDLLLIGTPVWGRSVTPAVRTYLTRYTDALPDTALFLTYGGSGAERVFAQLTALCGRLPLAALAIREHELRPGGWESRVRAFAAEVAALADRSMAARVAAHSAE